MGSFTPLDWVARREMRPRVDWMTRADDYILEALDQTGFVLSPRVLAVNIDFSRKYVSARLQTLEEHGLVVREGKGLYRMSDLGRQYLQGEVSASELESSSDDPES